MSIQKNVYVIDQIKFDFLSFFKFNEKLNWIHQKLLNNQLIHYFIQKYFMSHFLFPMLNDFDKECKQIVKSVEGSELEEDVRQIIRRICRN